jgi:hypothetical protein
MLRLFRLGRKTQNSEAGNVVSWREPGTLSNERRCDLDDHSNRVSVVDGLRCRETRFRGPETKAPKWAPKSNWPIVETERLHESPPIRGYSRTAGKSLQVADCLVGLRGFERPTRPLLPA